MSIPDYHPGPADWRHLDREAAAELWLELGQWVEWLRRRLGSAHIEAHVLERSWHVVTLDYDRERVAELAGEFLARVEAGA